MILFYSSTAFNSSSLDSKLENHQNNVDPINVKYIVRFEKNYNRICAGCLVSGRYVLSAAGCIHLVLETKKIEHRKLKVAAVIGGREYKILHAVYHSDYDPKSSRYCGFNDVGMALVIILFYLFKKNLFIKYLIEYCRSRG